MAHGKKLSKTKVQQLNIADICNQILQPDAPHSLRLQGILIGGVVIVFCRQQVYLMEDLLEMQRRLKSAGSPAVLQQGRAALDKRQSTAKPAAITYAVEEDLLSGGIPYNATPPTPALSSAAYDNQEEESDMLFHPASLALSREGTSSGTLGTRFLARSVPLAVPAPAPMDQLETFDVPEDDQLLFDADLDVSRPMDLQEFPHDPMLDDAMAPDHDAMPLNGADGGVNAPEAPAQAEDAADGAAPPADTVKADDGGARQKPDQAQVKDKPRGAAAVKSGKRRGGKGALTLDLDGIEVRGVEYRSWQTDHSDIVKKRRPDRRHVSATEGADSASAAPADPLDGHLANLLSRRGPKNAVPSSELQDLMRCCASDMSLVPGQDDGDAEDDGPGDKKRGSKRSAAAAAAAAVPPPAPAAAEEHPMMGFDGDELMAVPGDDALDMPAFDGPAPPSDIEQLRAGPGSDDKGLRGLLPTPGSLVGRMQDVGAAGRFSRGSSQSSLMPESEKRPEERAGVFRSGGSSPLLRFGSGALEDLLPAIDEGGGLGGGDLLWDILHEDGEQAGGESGSRKRRKSDPNNASQPHLGGSSGGLTQFQLLESSNPTPPGMPQNSMNRTTMTVIQVFRQRLNAVASQGDVDAALSFFALVQSLNRTEAVKLFYQVCVTTSTGFISVSQSAAFGDLVIRPGRFL